MNPPDATSPPKRKKVTHPMLIPHDSDDDEPMSWSDIERQLIEDDANWKRPENMIVNPNVWLPAADMHVFGSAPMEDDIDLRICKECGKPILASAVLTHVENCKKIRSLPPPKQPAKGKKSEASKPKATPTKKSGTKRKSEEGEEEEAPAKKKAKKESKPIGTGAGKGRYKGPVDLDIHCGVINDKGFPCSRKLTCKSHAMGPKRAVEGRSRPFDELLQEMLRQKPGYKEPVKRKTKEEKAAEKAREKEEKRLEREREKGLKSEEKAKAALAKANSKTSGVKVPGTGGSKKKGTAAQRAAAAAAEAAEAEAERQLDSEEEVDALVGVAQKLKRRAGPVAQGPEATNFFLLRNATLTACRDELVDALGGQAQGRMNVPTPHGIVAAS